MTQKAAPSPQEIAQFNALAHSWWDTQGPMKMLHALNPLRLSWIRGYCHTLKTKQILDVGCGGGILSESMAKEGAKVTGLDLAEDLIHVAQMHADSENVLVHYVAQNLHDHAEHAQQKYDVVTCLEMLEHVPTPSDIVAAIAACTKPGGLAFFSTINRTPSAFLQTIVGAEYVLNWLPKGTHTYTQFIKPSELESMLRKNGFSLKAMTGVTYNFLTQSFSLTHNTNALYMMVAIRD